VGGGGGGLLFPFAHICGVSRRPCRYYKTGSLMANSCRAIALLGGYPASVTEAAYRYGMHVGIAFQLVDDMLGE